MDNLQRPILIVDSMNMFVRAYVVFPSMSSHGYQMGGCVGFLKTLRKIVNETAPKMVIVVWEGGGSSRRRSLYSEYKMNRRPGRLNRFYEGDIPDSEENRKHQLLSLISLSKSIPVHQVYAADCEGDDVISWLCTGRYSGDNKIIVSSDKDMYQLLDAKTTIYNLHKKTFVTRDVVEKEYRIRAENFGIAKSLAGDVSDNIPGVKGLGFKTLVKLFPFLGTDNVLMLQDVFDYCHAHIDESKHYKKIIEEQDVVRRNWQLVQLNGSMVPMGQAERMNVLLDTHKPTIDKVGFIKMLVKEGINDFDVENFFYAFHCIENLT